MGYEFYEFSFDTEEQREYFAEDYVVTRAEYDAEIEREFQNLYDYE